MRKVIAAINMTLDGYCDHTAMISDDELHDHYRDLLHNTGVILYGRICYQLMENFWPDIASHPTGNKSLDEFAIAMDRVPKLVISRTLEQLHWSSAKLATRDLREEVAELRQQTGKAIMAGSPSLITALTNLNLIDEYQLTLHPVLAGKGLPLFRSINEHVVLKLLKTKKFKSGSITLTYEPSTR